MPDDYFIDSHCHFFNLDDILIYPFIERIKINFGTELLLAFGAIIDMFTGVLTRTIEEEKLELKKFITFFESERHCNILKTVTEVEDIPTHWSPPIPHFQDRKKILTPLIMDFEYGTKSKHKKLSNQVNRLIKSIQAISKDDSYPGHIKKLPDHIKILPFVGLDMRRFDEENDIDQAVDTFLEKYAGQLKSYEERRQFDRLKNGDIIGVKLYPPLGFYPLTRRGENREKYLNVYKRLAYYHKLPITVHCQRSGFSFMKKNEEEAVTEPDNWKKLLESRDCQNIRINLGHFGGDKELRKAVRLYTLNNAPGSHKVFDSINHKSWTITILKLLKKYRNAYADISALNWKDPLVCINFYLLLLRDENDKFDYGDYYLKDKLLWGSDYPMMLPNYKTYRDLFKDFLDFFKKDTYKEKRVSQGRLERREFKCDVHYKLDRDLNLDEFIENIVNKNPKKFLFDVDT